MRSLAITWDGGQSWVQAMGNDGQCCPRTTQRAKRANNDGWSKRDEPPDNFYLNCITLNASCISAKWAKDNERRWKLERCLHIITWWPAILFPRVEYSGSINPTPLSHWHNGGKDTEARGCVGANMDTCKGWSFKQAEGCCALLEANLFKQAVLHPWVIFFVRPKLKGINFREDFQTLWKIERTYHNTCGSK